MSGDGPRRVRALVVEEPGRAVVREVPDGALDRRGFRVRTLSSGLSLGTELTWLRGTNPALTSRWDADLGGFRPGEPSQAYPVERFGYMQVGLVERSRWGPVPEGARVAMTYGHRDGHTADGPAERAVVLPDDVPSRLGVLVAHLGPICANGLLHAAHDAVGAAVRDLGDGVRGRCVVVVGAGLVGLVTAVFAQHAGAAEVLVLDATPQRLAAARALGLATADTGQASPTDVAADVKGRYRHSPGDRGADVVLQCRGQDSALALGLACLRPQGTAVDLAFHTGGATALRLGEEFHHNGLSLRSAQIGRVPRGLAHAWDRERLSRETLRLLADRGTDLGRHVLTDDVALDDAPALLDDVSAHRRHVIGAVIGFV